MEKLLIIADDFTGALDTGIQFTKMGIRAKIITDCQSDFEKLADKYSLLVVNTDTRPLQGDEAYRRVYEVCARARKAGFQYIYKKTDSGLRGNIGAELQAVMDACGQRSLYFIPALPRLNRITRDGIQYINGVPVKESVFGQDPFEPVRDSDIEQIIRSQCDIQVVKIPAGAFHRISRMPEKKTIYLFDAETDEELCQIAEMLKKYGWFPVCAGCAGFASCYELLVDFEKGNMHAMQKTDGLLALCGSVNRITVRQMTHAEKSGFLREHLGNEQKLRPAYMDSEAGKDYLDRLFRRISRTDRFLLDTLDVPGEETAKDYAKRTGIAVENIRFCIADALGVIAAEMVRRGLNYTISMTGGDTLMGFMHQTGCTELIPVCEIGTGAVLSIMHWDDRRIQVISKSGGFGDENIFTQMYQVISGESGGKTNEKRVV